MDFEAGGQFRGGDHPVHDPDQDRALSINRQTDQEFHSDAGTAKGQAVH